MLWALVPWLKAASIPYTPTTMAEAVRNAYEFFAAEGKIERGALVSVSAAITR